MVEVGNLLDDETMIEVLTKQEITGQAEDSYT